MAENEFLDIKYFQQWKPILDKLEAGASGHELAMEIIKLLEKSLRKLPKRISSEIIEAAGKGNRDKLLALKKVLYGRQADFAEVALRSCESEREAGSRATAERMTDIMTESVIDRLRYKILDTPTRAHEAERLTREAAATLYGAQSRLLDALNRCRPSRSLSEASTPIPQRPHAQTRLPLAPNCLPSPPRAPSHEA